MPTAFSTQNAIGTNSFRYSRNALVSAAIAPGTTTSMIVQP